MPSEAEGWSPTATATASGVFARLTDSKNFTGAHRHRFDRDGVGRGLAGRDSVRKGAGWSERQPRVGERVDCVSQVLRPEPEQRRVGHFSPEIERSRSGEQPAEPARQAAGRSVRVLWSGRESLDLLDLLDSPSTGGQAAPGSSGAAAGAAMAEERRAQHAKLNRAYAHVRRMQLSWAFGRWRVRPLAILQAQQRVASILLHLMRLRLAQAWEGWHSAHVEAEWLLEQRVRDCARLLAGCTALRALAGWLAVAAQAHAWREGRLATAMGALRHRRQGAALRGWRVRCQHASEVRARVSAAAARLLFLRVGQAFRAWLAVKRCSDQRRAEAREALRWSELVREKIAGYQAIVAKGRLASAVAGWRDFVDRARAVRKCRRRIELSNQRCAMTAWVEYVDLCRAVRHCLQRISQRHLRDAVIGWSAWATAKRIKASKVQLASQLRMQRSTKRCLSWWQAWAARSLFRRRIVDRCVGLLRLRVLRAVLAGWRERTAESVWLRRLLETAHARMANRILARAITEWASAAATVRERRRKLVGALQRLHAARLSAACLGWREHCLLASELRRKLSVGVARLSHRQTSRAWAGWVAFVATALRLRQLYAHAVGRLAYSRLSGILSGWAAAVELAYLKFQSLERAESHVRHKRLVAGWRQWQAMLLELRHLRDRALKVMAGSMLARAFRRWVVATGEQQQIYSAVSTVLQRVSSRRPFVAAWSRWVEMVEVAKVHRQIAGRAMDRMRAILLSAAMAGWWAQTAENMRLRNLLARASHRMAKASLSRAFSAWLHFVGETQRLRNAIARLALVRLASVLSRWAALAQERRAQRQTVGLVTRRMSSALLGMAFVTWQDKTAQATRRRNLLQRASLRMNTRATSAALSAWVGHLAATQRLRAIGQNAAARLASRRLFWVWSGWLAALASEKERRQVVERVARRRQSTLLGWATSAWQARTEQAARRRNLLSRAHLRLSEKIAAQSWHGWVARTGEKKRLRGLGLTACHRLSFRRMGAAFKGWLWAINARRAEERMERALQHMRNGLLLRAWNRWIVQKSLARTSGMRKVLQARYAHIKTSPLKARQPRVREPVTAVAPRAVSPPRDTPRRAVSPAAARTESAPRPQPTSEASAQQTGAAAREADDENRQQGASGGQVEAASANGHDGHSTLQTQRAVPFVSVAWVSVFVACLFLCFAVQTLQQSQEKHQAQEPAVSQPASPAEADTVKPTAEGKATEEAWPLPGLSEDTASCLILLPSLIYLAQSCVG